MNLTIGQFVGHDPHDLTILHDQVDQLEFIVNLDTPADRLPVKGIQYDPSSPVRCMAGPFDRSLSEIAGVASKGPLGNPSIRGPIEGNPHMLQLVDGPRSILGQNLGCILIGEIIGAFDRVVHVPFPGVWLFISQCRSDSPLGCAGMGPRRVDFADQSHISHPGHFHGGSQTGKAGTHNHNVVLEYHCLLRSFPAWLPNVIHPALQEF